MDIGIFIEPIVLKDYTKITTLRPKLLIYASIKIKKFTCIIL